MRQKTLLMFDLDGTLVDSRADLTTAVNLMRADYGLPPLSVQTVTRYVGNGITRLVERSLAESPPPVALEAAVETMRRHYRGHLLDRTVLYPGTAGALEALRQAGFPLAVVTNKPEAAAREIVEGLGIAANFTCVVGGGTCASIKPDPESLFYALRRGGCSPSLSWMVGDNYTDLAAGARAGVKRCFCRYGFGSAGDETYDVAVDSLTDFVAVATSPMPRR